MANPFEWKLANPENAKALLSNDPLGSASIDHKPVGLELKSGLSFGLDGGTALTLNFRGALTVAVLNEAKDPDEDGILVTGPDAAAGDALSPQLVFDPRRAYVKYRAEAGVKAGLSVPVGPLFGIAAGAEAGVVFADYRVHDRGDFTRDTILREITTARLITHLEHVLGMQPGDALAFRFGGALNVALTVSWSDIFTGQIGTLSKRLGARVPLALSVHAGATLTLSVGVSDDFQLVFSRQDTTWRVGVRKVKSSRVAPSLDAGVDVGIANPDELQGLIMATLEGFLGAPLHRVNSILAAASLESLGTVERKLAKALIERLGLDEAFATIETLRERVKEVQDRVATVIEDVVKTRIALSFSYEYSRVSIATNLVEATLDRAAVQALHADLIIMGRTDALVEAALMKRPGVAIERYLNQKELTRSRSFGFTLGFGKWATIGGENFKKVRTVQRRDLQNRLQESYLGTRLYTGTWVGATQQWGVDLKADMKDYSAEPKVTDYSFGIHLLWASEQEELSGTELEEWLDSAIVWRVFREEDLVDIRARAVGALGKGVSLTVQVTVPNSVLRAVLPALSQAAVDAYAQALAVAMPYMKLSPARTSAAARRRVYSPLWALYLQEPQHSVDTFGKAAADHLRKVGHPEMVLTETAFLNGPDPFSFAGLTKINGNTRAGCDAFTHGTQILQSAIASGARNQKTIDKVFAEMDDLWKQSHHVRAIGVYLLDAAERAGQLTNVTRTMTLKAEGSPETLVVTA